MCSTFRRSYQEPQTWVIKHNYLFYEIPFKKNLSNCIIRTFLRFIRLKTRFTAFASELERTFTIKCLLDLSFMK